jgi:hypothetical protein
VRRKPRWPRCERARPARTQAPQRADAPRCLGCKAHLGLGAPARGALSLEVGAKLCVGAPLSRQRSLQRGLRAKLSSSRLRSAKGVSNDVATGAQGRQERRRGATQKGTNK